MTNSSDFGLYLSLLREQSGYKSQRELALKAGISPATLSRIESGLQHPTPDTLQILSKYLRGTSYIDLMDKAGYFADERDLLLVNKNGNDRKIFGTTPTENNDIDPEWIDLHEKIKQKGAELEATAILRTASKMSKKQLKDILKVFEMIEKDED